MPIHPELAVLVAKNRLKYAANSNDDSTAADHVEYAIDDLAALHAKLDRLKDDGTVRVQSFGEALEALDAARKHLENSVGHDGSASAPTDDPSPLPLSGHGFIEDGSA